MITWLRLHYAQYWKVFLHFNTKSAFKYSSVSQSKSLMAKPIYFVLISEDKVCAVFSLFHQVALYVAIKHSNWIIDTCQKENTGSFQINSNGFNLCHVSQTLEKRKEKQVSQENSRARFHWVRLVSHKAFCSLEGGHWKAMYTVLLITTRASHRSDIRLIPSLRATLMWQTAVWGPC